METTIAPAAKTNLTRLNDHICYGHISDSQAEFIIDLLNGKFKMYQERMNFCIPREQQNSIDSATPEMLNRKLAEILPRHEFPLLAYDYRNNQFGQYLNLDRLFLNKMYSLFNI